MTQPLIESCFEKKNTSLLFSLYTTSAHASDTRYMVFPTQFGSLQFSSIGCQAGLAQPPLGKDSALTRQPPSTLSSVLLAGRLQIRVPTTPSLALIICFNGSQNSGRHICWFIVKGLIRDIVEQLDEEIHRERARVRELLPRGVGVCHSPGMYMYSPTSKCSEPCPLRRLHHIGMID